MGMNIFGIGPLEFILFLVIALLILGPERMVSTSRSIARFIRQVITSPNWRTVQNVQSEMRNLPNQLLREAGLEDIDKVVPSMDEIAKEAGLDELSRQVNQVQKEVSGEWNTIANEMSESTKPPASPPDSGIPTISVPPSQSVPSQGKPKSKQATPPAESSDPNQGPPVIKTN